MGPNRLGLDYKGVNNVIERDSRNMNGRELEISGLEMWFVLELR